MDIHKPKAAHSLREFLIEIGTIICGILIALSLEQGIEWLHWRHEVEETREALKVELAHDLGVIHVAAEQIGCTSQQLEDLKRWEDSYKRGAPLTLTGRITGPGGWTFYTDAWTVAQTGQVAAHIPLEERNRYAQLYGQIRAQEAFAQKRRDQWDELSDFDGAENLNHSDLMRLHGLIRRVDRYAGGIRLNLELMEKRAAALDVKAEKLGLPGGGHAYDCPSLLEQR